MKCQKLLIKGLVCGLLELKVQLDCLLLVLEGVGIHAVSGSYEEELLQ